MGSCETVATRQKRQLESDDDFEDEATDTVDCATLELRRGRKQARRVSGVARDIKSLASIGHNANVMMLDLNYMHTKDIMQAGTTCSMWYILGCKIFRKRLGDSPFLRFWHDDKPLRYLWMNWELHFHDELLAGTEEDDPMGDGPKSNGGPVIPAIQALITVGNRAAYEQITHDDAKLPFRQEHIYIICDDAVVSLPKEPAITTFYQRFGLPITVQSLFIPKSPHFTMKAFGVDILKDEWTEEDIKGVLELPKEDVGSGQELKTVLLIKYITTPSLLNFTENVAKSYTYVELLGGDAADIGCNRAANCSSQVMKQQVESSSFGFCFLTLRDGRPPVEKVDENPNPDPELEDWNEFEDPEPKQETFFEKVREALPGIQVLGIDSHFPIDFLNVKYSNVDETSNKEFCCGLFVLTY